MGRKVLMSWEGEPNCRWVKCYRRTRYRVTCEELRVNRSKQDSWLAANEWWRKKKAELDQKTYEQEHAEAIKRLDAKIAYAGSHSTDLLPPLQKERARLTKVAPCDVSLTKSDDRYVYDPTTRRVGAVPIDHSECSYEQESLEDNIRVAELLGIRCSPGVSQEVLQHFFGDARLWSERFMRSRLVEKQNTLGACLDAFLAEVRVSQKPASHAEMNSYLQWLVDESGLWTRHTDVATVSEQTVLDHYSVLVKRNYGPGAHNKRLAFFRRFVVWLWVQRKVVEMPRNLKLKSHRKRAVHKAVKTFDGVWNGVKALKPRYRLWALLCLNCGMTNADLGGLKWNMIDETKWTLTRRRVKTESHEKVPTVTYRLWPETVALLKALPKTGSRLFSTKTGRPMYESRYEGDGETSKKDLFGTYWKRQRSAPNPTKSDAVLAPGRVAHSVPHIPLSKFRSIGSTALKAHLIFGRFDEYFLGHAPRSIADRHYAAEADDPFFAATDFIRDHLIKASSHATVDSKAEARVD
jgi:integrase